MFVIEDELHAEQQGEFATFDDAVAELKRRSTLPWNVEPNLAPCQSWKTCGRKYEVIEYDDSSTPWREVQRHAVLEINASGAVWLNSKSNEARA